MDRLYKPFSTAKQHSQIGDEFVVRPSRYLKRYGFLSMAAATWCWWQLPALSWSFQITGTLLLISYAVYGYWAWGELKNPFAVRKLERHAEQWWLTCTNGLIWPAQYLYQESFCAPYLMCLRFRTEEAGVLTVPIFPDTLSPPDFKRLYSLIARAA